MPPSALRRAAAVAALLATLTHAGAAVGGVEGAVAGRGWASFLVDLPAGGAFELATATTAATSPHGWMLLLHGGDREFRYADWTVQLRGRPEVRASAGTLWEGVHLSLAPPEAPGDGAGGVRLETVEPLRARLTWIEGGPAEAWTFAARAGEGGTIAAWSFGDETFLRDLSTFETAAAARADAAAPLHVVADGVARERVDGVLLGVAAPWGAAGGLFTAETATGARLCPCLFEEIAPGRAAGPGEYAFRFTGAAVDVAAFGADVSVPT